MRHSLIAGCVDRELRVGLRHPHQEVDVERGYIVFLVMSVPLHSRENIFLVTLAVGLLLETDDADGKLLEVEGNSNKSDIFEDKTVGAFLASAFPFVLCPPVNQLDVPQASSFPIPLKYTN